MSVFGYSRFVSVVVPGFFLAAGVALSGTVSSTMIFFTPWSITIWGAAGAAATLCEAAALCGAAACGAGAETAA